MNNYYNILWLVLIFAIAAGVVLALMPVLLPRLRALKMGQTIYEKGPKHQQKQGTPNMGGLLIALGTIVAVCAGAALLRKDTDAGSVPYFSFKNPLWGLVLVSVACMLIGFADDFIKDVKKRHDGLSPKQKLVMQLVVGVLFSIYCSQTVGTEILLPFTDRTLDLGVAYIPVMTVLLMFITNSANLQDGLDGLLSTVTAIGMLAFGLLCGFLNEKAGLPPAIRPVMLCGGVALCGAAVGFLRFNHYPAKIFMGDTGSMMIGGMMIGVAMLSRCVLPMFLFCLTSVCSSLSVMIQVTYFKLTHGKRLFKMSPIHHHFELCGMKEPQIVRMYAIVTLIASIIAWLIMLGFVR